MLGPLPGGFLRFFTSRFPRLLLAVYVFALQHLAEEPSLQQYWQSEQGGPDSSHSFVQVRRVGLKRAGEGSVAWWGGRRRQRRGKSGAPYT